MYVYNQTKKVVNLGNKPCIIIVATSSTLTGGNY